MTGSTNTGGAGLNLRIVGTNTQPPKPTENMVWINTSTRIPNWYWQAAEPGSSLKKEGVLWIGVNPLSANMLDLLRNNNLIVGFGTARQYINGAWKTVGGKIYHSGSWYNLQTFVYDGSIGSPTGNYNANVGGQPWTIGTDGGGATITNYSDHFRYTSSGTGAQWGATAKQIDFTGVNSVKVTYSYDGYYDMKFVVFTNKSTSGTRDNPNAQSSLCSRGTKLSATINVSGLSGNFWLGISSSGFGGNPNLDVFTIELIT